MNIGKISFFTQKSKLIPCEILNTGGRTDFVTIFAEKQK